MAKSEEGSFRAQPEQYLMGHQSGLHATLVSIALGVAGISAASLLPGDPQDQGFLNLFRVLWLVSLLGIGIVYAGVTVSVFLLPDKLPMVVDTFLPFGVGLAEFTLFAILTPPLLQDTGPSSVAKAWFWCFSLFGLTAFFAIHRAMWLFEQTDPARRADADAARGERVHMRSRRRRASRKKHASLDKLIDDQIKRMRKDSYGALSCAALGAAAATSITLDTQDSLPIGYLFAATIAGDLIYGLSKHDHSTRLLQEDLRARRASENAHPSAQ